MNYSGYQFHGGLIIFYVCLFSIVFMVMHHAIYQAVLIWHLICTMSSDVPLGGTHYMRRSFIYRGVVAWNALPNAVKDSGSLSAFRINLKHHIRTL